MTGEDADEPEVTLELLYDLGGATFDPATGEFRWTPNDATPVEIA